ncbi:MAG: RagB/SusD family nutrient uptake outer membrane protein [Niastella sp.]|uniref:RagB/SusD family nutrient uptake outer membrane protein n=1 Tax=Niastella sp. TaxID=1869183 RepID=UPI003899B515
MKRLAYINLLLAIWGTVSCSKSFLDKAPQAVLSTATITSDTSTLGMAVNRLYGSLAWREYTLGRQQWSTHELCADDYIPGSDANMNFFQNYSYQADNGYVQQYWDRTYQNIHYCNVVIDNVGTVAKSAPASALLYEAQGKYFRAYYNFDLTNVFGDAPLRDHDPSAAEYNIVKSPHADIIKLVIADLKFASANLPTRQQWGTSNLGRVTKGTAQGLLAKVYLYEQDYTNAKLYADSVINGGEYSLYPNYRNLFSPDQLYSSENMMPGGYIFNSAIWSGRWYNPYLQYQGLPAFANGVIYPSDKLVNSYESGDPRLAATIFTKTDTIMGYNNNKPVAFPANTSYANKKVIWPFTYWNQSNFSFQNVNPMFLRYADIVLIDAEASNELGNTADALKYLEQIRYRARGNMTFTATVAAGMNGGAGILPQITFNSKAQLRLAIWQERRIELALEFNRWFDLVRYNKVATADGSNGTGYTENLLKYVYGRTGFNYARFSHFPIPATYITSSNGVLIQNNNW